MKLNKQTMHFITSPGNLRVELESSTEFEETVEVGIVDCNGNLRLSVSQNIQKVNTSHFILMKSSLTFATKSIQ